LDTSTGQTWELDKVNGTWAAVPQATDLGHDPTSDRYDTFLVKVERPPLGHPTASPPTSEQLRRVPGVASVELVDPRDPLGVLPYLEKRKTN
jgi:hypothetical protein